jgi:hypothetical protein
MIVELHVDNVASCSETGNNWVMYLYIIIKEDSGTRENISNSFLRGLSQSSRREKIFLNTLCGAIARLDQRKYL